jgi:hypothetical protein
MDRHATPLGHISLIKNLTVFTISPKFCVLSVEATHTNFIKRIIGVMVSVLASSVVDRGFEPRSGQTNDYKIYICFFSAKHATLRSKSKYWLARNQNNVSEWSDMFIRGLLFQWVSAL